MCPRSSTRRRSDARAVGNRRIGSRSVAWRSVLLIAPLVYGVGSLAGDLLAVSLFGAPAGVLVSGGVVLVACPLVSAGLARLFDRVERTEPRAIGSITPARTSITVGAVVLVPAFLFGLGLATLA
ncbi:hypothetical protein BRC68_14695 [Halobacteriales archaeon QH_6_64_20]|nr:MAG: hypothetical protein BRC68_14695 [Halobacteriales archaeon QH_6_64_20]